MEICLVGAVVVAAAADEKPPAVGLFQEKIGFRLPVSGVKALQSLEPGG